MFSFTHDFYELQPTDKNPHNSSAPNLRLYLLLDNYLLLFAMQKSILIYSFSHSNTVFSGK